MCEKWDIKRLQLEEYALESHTRALRAIDEGRFEREITPVAGISVDEARAGTPRWRRWPSSSRSAEGWELTAAAASQISDGAAALLIASEDAVKRHGLTPRPGSATLTVTWADPVFMLTGPIPATEMALAKAKLSIGDIDVFEVNEAFAPVLIACVGRDRGVAREDNPNGGAIALGHPLGALARS